MESKILEVLASFGNQFRFVGAALFNTFLILLLTTNYLQLTPKLTFSKLS